MSDIDNTTDSGEKVTVKKKVSKQKIVYPSKRYINLAEKKRAYWNVPKLLLLLVIILAVVAVMSKFMVMDELVKVDDAERKYNEAVSQLEELDKSLQDYNEILEKYSAMSTKWMTEEEEFLIYRGDILDMVETILMSQAEINNISIVGDVLSIRINGIDLQKTADLIKQLEAQPIVAKVIAQSSSTVEGTTKVQTALLINMQYVEKGAEE